MAITHSTIIDIPEKDGSAVSPQNRSEVSKSKNMGKNRAAEIDSFIFIPKSLYHCLLAFFITAYSILMVLNKFEIYYCDVKIVANITIIKYLGL